MAIVRVNGEKLTPLPATTFTAAGLGEREDLQRLLRTQIDVLDPDLLVIGEEFSEWEGSRRRIDLLALDRDARLVVIELKRDDSAHMELQALRYAAMVSPMTFSQVCRTLDQLFEGTGDKRNPAETVLAHIGWVGNPEVEDAEPSIGDARIVLVSSDFSRELTTTVLWLLDKGVDIRCVRMRPYLDGDTIFADVQQILPLPEAEAYMVGIRDKRREEAEASQASRSIADFRSDLPAELVAPAEKLLDWFSSHVSHLWFGSDRGGVSCVPTLQVGSQRRHLVRFTTKGKVAFRPDWAGRFPPFSEPKAWSELMTRINKAGVALPVELGTNRPSFHLSQLDDPSAMAAFLDAMGWWVEQTRSALE